MTTTIDNVSFKLDTNINGIQQLYEKFKELSEQNVDDDFNVDIRKKQWQYFLQLWTKMMELLSNSKTNTDVAYFQKCTEIVPIISKKVDIDNLVTKDNSVVQDTLFTCFNLLNMPVVHQYLLNQKEADLPFNNIFYTTIDRLLMLIMLSWTYFSCPNELPENYVTLLNILVAYFDKEITNDILIDVDVAKHPLGGITIQILALFTRMTDPTIFIPWLLHTNLPTSVIRWLADSDIMHEDVRLEFILMIYNIARHDDGADELNNYKTIDIVKQYKSRDKVKNDTKHLLVCFMAIALLSTPEQLKRDKKGMNVVLNQLLQMTIDATTNNTAHYGLSFHISEPLAVLVKLFVVEERTLDYILIHAETEAPSDMASTIKLFADLLIVFSDLITSKDPLKQLTCIALSNILWSISFQTQYQDELKENKELINTIRRLANDGDSQMIDQYKPRSMQSMKKATDGILFNLHEQTNNFSYIKILKTNSETIVNPVISELMTKLPIHHSSDLGHTAADQTSKLLNGEDGSISTDGLPMIMFSYSHKDKDFCHHILKEVELTKNQFKVWIDFRQCVVDDPWDKIADAIEQATVIICFISEYYQQSKSCRQEFIYAADDLEKPIVPILMGNYKPRGWLGIRKAGMNYIRFHDIIQPNQSEIKKLIERIQAVISSHTNIPTTLTTSSHYDMPILRQQKSLGQETSQNNIPNFTRVNEWTSEDICHWFDQQHIMKQIHDLYKFQSGIEMLDYAQTLLEDQDDQHKIYSQLFTQKYEGELLPPHEFNRFVNAMERLVKEYSPKSSINKHSTLPVTSTIQTGSRTCIII